MSAVAGVLGLTPAGDRTPLDAFLAEATGDPERALRLLGAVARLSDETGAGLLEPQLDRYPRRDPAEEQYDAATVAALKAEGYAMTRDEAIAYARADATD